NAAMSSLADRLEILTDQRQAEQELLAGSVESQNETRIVLAKISEGFAATRAARAGPAIDAATRSHLRNLDQHVKHILDGAERGRDQPVNDIRSEIKLLARTLGAAVDSAGLRAGDRPASPRGEGAP